MTDGSLLVNETKATDRPASAGPEGGRATRDHGGPLTRRWTEGTYGLDSILAYSAVCAGGVDTVPLPGDTSEAAIAAIVGDVATLAFKWNKPLAARLLPAHGKKAGEMTEFSGALANAIIQPLPGAKR